MAHNPNTINKAVDLPASEQFARSAFKPDGWYARYALSLLVLVYVFNMIDRQILSILAEDIKADLKLSDGDIGFLYGTAFAVFYAVFGIPLARLADGWRRTRLIAVGMGIWSLLTALSGTAKGFLTLSVYRFGVAIGEASATPAANSLLYDYFSHKFRTTAIAIYNSGSYIGMGLGVFLGGYILDSWYAAYPVAADAPFGLKGWQVAFMAVGMPGLVLAVFMAFLREPDREKAEQGKAVEPVKILKDEFAAMVPLVNLWVLRREGAGRAVLCLNIGLGLFVTVLASYLFQETDKGPQWLALLAGFYCVFSWVQSLYCRDAECFRLLFGCRTVLFVYIGTGFSVFFAVALIFWTIPYFQRFHGVEASEVGLVVGASTALAGLLGVLLGGAAADWLAKYTSCSKILIVLVASIAGVSFAALMLLSTDLHLAYAFSFLSLFSSTMGQAPMLGVIGDLMVARTRAVGFALVGVSSTFFGAALGPYFVGVLSDAFIAGGVSGGAALRQALFVAMASSAVGIAMYIGAARCFEADVAIRDNRASQK